MRDSSWLYPTANLVHILGIAILLGAILALDLRLLGLGRGSIALPGAARYLSPLAAAGLALAIPGGFLLFAADAGPMAAHPVIQAKAVLIAFGLLNVALFHALWWRRLDVWGSAPPVAGRVMALLSMALWLAAAACGRLAAYF
ncbi:MAG: hypothetical protein FJX53_05155 [Alphaproteobacteria bacterium]|nr:hypothetical protein [Alphaproteobacteria bacterium]